MNVPGSRGGWTSHGGSKNQLGPDKQHRQSGMLSSGKKGDQSKMPLSKLMWKHIVSCHTTLQLWFNYSSYQNSALSTSEQHWSTVMCWPGTLVNCMCYLWALFLYEDIPSCICILQHLKLKWRSHNNGSFFWPNCGLLSYIDIGREHLNHGQDVNIILL
jgi:hypothetical protein